jgi:hypothetical protein
MRGHFTEQCETGKRPESGGPLPSLRRRTTGPARATQIVRLDVGTDDSAFQVGPSKETNARGSRAYFEGGRLPSSCASASSQRAIVSAVLELVP